MGLMMGAQDMPKVAKERSALEVKRLTRPGMHFVGLVPGLALQVLPTGGRTWVLRTMVGARRRDMGLGGFPEVTLADARVKAREAREKIRQGIDPIAQAQAARDGLRNTVRMTFAEAAEKFIDSHRAGWRNEKSALQWASSLEQYATPFIGSHDVAQVGIAHVLQVLEQPVPTTRSAKDMNGKLWTHRPETAQRLRGRIENILDWAKGRGLRSGDNPAAWKGCLDAQLPRLEKSKRVVHHRAMALEDMASFMAELRQREGMAARALEFAILCASRSGEVRGMVWQEIDLNARLWVIPKTRMKASREHRIPLSDEAVALLEALPRLQSSELVFPAPRGGQLSDMSLLAVLRRMSRKEVPHGFRSSFRDWASERTSYPSEMAELALAHSVANRVEAAYRRGDQLEKRRQMMQDWSDFCRRVAPRGIVVRIRERA